VVQLATARFIPQQRKLLQRNLLRRPDTEYPLTLGRQVDRLLVREKCA
jgi:hypothetical protein